MFPFLQGYSIPIFWVVNLDLEFLLRIQASIAVNTGTPSPSRLSVTVSRYISFCHYYCLCYCHFIATICLCFYHCWTRSSATVTGLCHWLPFSLSLSVLLFTLFWMSRWVSLTVTVSSTVLVFSDTCNLSNDWNIKVYCVFNHRIRNLPFEYRTILLF